VFSVAFRGQDRAVADPGSIRPGRQVDPRSLRGWGGFPQGVDGRRAVGALKGGERGLHSEKRSSPLLSSMSYSVARSVLIPWWAAPGWRLVTRSALIILTAAAGALSEWTEPDSNWWIFGGAVTVGIVSLIDLVLECAGEAKRRKNEGSPRHRVRHCLETLYDCLWLVHPDHEEPTTDGLRITLWILEDDRHTLVQLTDYVGMESRSRVAGRTIDVRTGSAGSGHPFRGPPGNPRHEGRASCHLVEVGSDRY